MGPKDLPEGITHLLSWFDEDRDAAFDQVMALANDHLRGEAKRQMQRMAVDGGTLQPTALVNEAYIRLHNNQELELLDRNHFFWFTSQVFRNILADYVRARRAEKRGDGMVVSLEGSMDAASQSLDPNTFLSINEALSKLEVDNPRQAQVVVLRFFFGSTIKEVGDIMELSVSTVKQEWAAAKVWLFWQLKGKK